MSEFRHETARLILRDWRDEDWPTFWKLTNTPAVMKWLGDPAGIEARAAARTRLETYRKNFGHTFWIVERKADGGHLSGKLLGFCGLKRANVEGTSVFDMPEIGWRLREAAWGFGYAKEAALASLKLGFGKFGYGEIIALTVSGNVASWGLMESLGMKRRTELDFVDDNWPDHLNPTIVYSITAEQWGHRAHD